MGSVLLGIVARSRKSDDKKSSSDLNFNLEVGECAKKVHLLEAPPLGVRHRKPDFNPVVVTEKIAKIGKIAKISDRSVSDIRKAFEKVSE